MYQFEFVLTDAQIQQRIIDFIKPVRYVNDLVNLQLMYGLKERESGLFFTRIKCSVRMDWNTELTLYTSHFVVLTSEESFQVSYTSDNLQDAGELVYDVPKMYEELLKQAFDFWRKWEAHKSFERTQRELGLDVTKRNLELKRPLMNKLQEEIIHPQRVVKQHFTIHSEEDARKLFFLCGTDCYHKMKDNYDEETVRSFEQYASGEKRKAWVMEECKAVLAGITAGDMDRLHEKLGLVAGRCNYWISADGDNMAAEYTEACRVAFTSGVAVPVVCINSYLELFTGRFNLLGVKELLDLTESYLKTHFAEEYEKGDYSSAAQSFKRKCSQIRGRIAELLPAENKGAFQFVETEQSTLTLIVEWYRNKYHDEDAVKEELAYLNCAYGVQNEQFFLTSASEAADSLMNHSWDRYDFVAVSLETRELLEFRCRRKGQDGGFELDYYQGSVKEHYEVLMEAVSFFRNETEREQFFEKVERSHGGKNMYVLKEEAHEALFSIFAPSYEAEMQRIGDNPLADTLKKMVELCENRAYENGFQNTIIREPASEEKIVAWEKTHGFRLPDSFRSFLLFANGVQLLSSSERIWGLDGLGRDDEYLNEGYLSIGEMIGDGTMICLSKCTGKVFVEDHGEYEERGDFKDFLEYLVEFLWDV